MSNFVIRWLLHHFHISISCEETWISIKYGSDLITPKIFHVVTVKMKMWWKKGITIYWKVWNVCTYLFVLFSKKKVSKSFSLKLLLLAYCHATHKVATNGWDSTIKYLCKSVVARKLIFYKTAQNDKTDKLFVCVCRHIVQLELFSKKKIAIL